MLFLGGIDVNAVLGGVLNSLGFYCRQQRGPGGVVCCAVSFGLVHSFVGSSPTTCKYFSPTIVFRGGCWAGPLRERREP